MKRGSNESVTKFGDTTRSMVWLHVWMMDDFCKCWWEEGVAIFLFNLLCHKYLLRWWRNEGNRGKHRQVDEHHVWLSICVLPLTCRADFPELSLLFSFSSLKFNKHFRCGERPPAQWVFKGCTLKEKNILIILSVYRWSFTLCAVLLLLLLTIFLTDRGLAAFISQYFIIFGSFYFMWFLCHCTTCLYSSLSTVCEVQRWLVFWLVKATVWVLQRGGAFVSVVFSACSSVSHTHIHTQQYHTASSYVFMLVFCKQ